VVAKKPVRLLLPRGTSDRVTAKVVYQGPLVAPVEQGREVGRLRVTRGDAVALEQPLYAGETVEAGTLSQRALDAAMEVGTDLVRRAFEKAKGGNGSGGTSATGAVSGNS
jgi:D-alanyl-D-alanine carboxypeptidase (penicillin-binding protein 5/6)